MQREGYRNKKYSKELKLSAVRECLAGKGSQREICRKYGIRGKRTLEFWIQCYNSYIEFRERSALTGEIYMTKGRKTTREERVEIVAFCIEHGKDYGLTVHACQVSCQQNYSWVRKYEKKGADGLADRRGKARPESELTETERLRMENKILKRSSRIKKWRSHC